jgi:predicted GIY-YIG superfamily endonuclease
MKHVYILEAGNGHKKIGIAADIKQRMQQLKTGISTGIKSVLMTEKMHNASAIETKLKKANKEINLVGEWFDGKLDLCGIEFNLYSTKKERKNGEGVMLFHDELHLLSSVVNKQTMFLYNMVSRMDENNIVPMTSYVRELIMDEIGTKSKDKLTLARQYTKILIDAGLITEVGRSTYMVNPKLFGFSNVASSVNKKQDKFIKIKYRKNKRTIEVGLLNDDNEQK